MVSIKNQFWRKVLGDFSLWLLLFSNLATIFFAIAEGWNFLTIVWVYWFQSIIIGLFNFIRILQLKKFSTKGLEINDKPAESTTGTKIFTAFFFLFHYGLFHLFYLVFLLSNTFTNFFGAKTNLIDVKFIFLGILIFFINHLISFIYNRPKDTEKQNIGTLMFYPYARIIPMHLVILLGFSFSKTEVTLLFFLILKTLSDTIMHIVEHRFIRKAEEQTVINL